MKSLIKIIAILSLVFSFTAVEANSTLDELKSMESGDKLLQQRTNSKKFAVTENKYSIVVFYSSTCPHCKAMEPILEEYSKNSGLPIVAFSTSNGESLGFSDSAEATPELIQTFYGDTQSVSVPGIFVINNESLEAYPAVIGQTSYVDLSSKVQSILEKAEKGGNTHV